MALFKGKQIAQLARVTPQTTTLVLGQDGTTTGGILMQDIATLVQSGVAQLSSTDQLAEGVTHLYYTNARVTSQIGVVLPNTDSLAEGTVHLYYTNARVDARVALASRSTTTTLSSVAGVLTINYALGDFFKVTLTENITSIVFTNLPAAGTGISIMLEITQAAVPDTVAWPASFKWPLGAVASVSTIANAVDVLALTSFDSGTTWKATLAKSFA